MTSKRRQEGWFFTDNSVAVANSPNPYPVEADVRRANAAGCEFVGMAVPTYESATITCVHCSRVVVLNPQRTRERGYCAPCDSYLCDGCALSRKLGAPHVSMAQRTDSLILTAERTIARHKEGLIGG